jgi:hypothetical protein
MPDQWYYSRDGQQQLGPISGTALREMAAKGQLGRGDLVWTEGMSQWAPAESTRSLFPSAAPKESAAQAPVPAIPAGEPTATPRPRRVDRDDFQGPRNIRRKQGGLSTGAKVALCFGFLGLFLLLAFVAIIAVAVIEEESVLPRNPKNAWGGPQRRNFNAPPGGGFMVPPPPLVVPPDFKVVQNNNFEIDLKFKGEEHKKHVELQQNQLIRVTITTTKWGGGITDVDLHIFNPRGFEIAKDDGDSKDCNLEFFAPSTGTYEFLTVLDRGDFAHCVVNIEILGK